jgi:hypothetical protein
MIVQFQRKPRHFILKERLDSILCSLIAGYMHP